MRVSHFVASFGVFAVALSACSKPKAPDAALPASGGASTAAGNAGGDFGGKTPEQALDAAIQLSLETVYFDFDSSVLTDKAQEQLRIMSKALNADSKLGLVVEGHADARGSNEYNLALSQRRSDSIRDFLKSEGVADARLQTQGKGEEQPAVEGLSEDAFSKNRRAEFRKLVNP